MVLFEDDWRDVFAAVALIGVQRAAEHNGRDYLARDLAQEAYTIAEAMVDQRQVALQDAAIEAARTAAVDAPAEAFRDACVALGVGDPLELRAILESCRPKV